ncbi:MAG: hypothetical protein AABY64_06170 [Bdellovibrionota bacterium]
MKKFLAIYYGSPASMDKWANLSEAAKLDRQKEGIKLWSNWGEKNSKLIKDVGNPLGKTKKVDGKGVSDIKNQLTAYTIVEAETHDEAAKLFLKHPHFEIFPGDSIEIMECLSLPSM